MKFTFTDKLIEAIREKKSILNVGLDPQLEFMPPHLVKWAVDNFGRTFEAVGRIYELFNRSIIDAAHPYAVSVKPNIAFYEIYGHWGMYAFEQTIEYARKRGLIVITDAKRGDGGDTAEAYADGHIGEIPFFNSKIASSIRSDAITIHAQIGSSCVKPFVTDVKEYGTGAFVVAKTSFIPNSEIEQLIWIKSPRSRLSVFWEALAEYVDYWGMGTEGKYGYRNFGAVMGATYPEDAKKMRQILPNAWFLIPGYGAQGGGADGAVVGINEDGFGGIVNSSRGIIAAWQKGKFICESEKFAEASAKAAEFSWNELNAALKRAGKLSW